MALTFADVYNDALSDDFTGTTATTRAKQAVNDALRDIARQTRLPALEASSALSIVAGTASYALPTDFVRVIEMYDPTFHEPLTETSQEALDSYAAGSGRPLWFALYGGSIVLSPTPTAGQTVSLRYQKVGATLTSDASTLPIPDEYAHMLVEYARSRLYRFDDDAEMSVFWAAEYARSLARLRGDMQLLTRSVRRVPGPYRGLRVPRFVEP